MIPLLTIEKAAEILSISVKTLYRWVNERRIANVKVGGTLRFEEKELERFISEHRRESDSVWDK